MAQGEATLAVSARGDVLVAWIDFTKPQGAVYAARSVR